MSSATATANDNAYTSRPTQALAGARRTTNGAGETPAMLALTEQADEVRCVACAHRCLVRPGRRGICHVRENRDGRLISLVYGEAVAAVEEPIEKKPLFHAWPGSLAYSIATRGCNFHCSFCQNWEIAQADREGLRPQTVSLPPRAVVARALAANARSVAYTYVEPTVFIEYVVDAARIAHEAGLANVMVTNGYQTPEALDLLGPLIDAANVDLKGFTDRFYRTVCGARLTHVLDALVGMRERGIWVEVTTLLIPGENDAPGELAALSRWIVAELGPDTPWHVSRFHPGYRWMTEPRTPLETIRRAVDTGRAAGLHHVYAGNVDGLVDNDTHCPGCGRVLLRRRGFAVVASDLVTGACPDCGRRLAGIGLGEAVRS